MSVAIPKKKKRAKKGPKYPVTHLRSWRKYRDITLKQLEQRMEKSPGEPLISSVSLGRIERGEQAYTQPILEAAAVALGCDVADILTVNPFKEGVVIDLMRIIRAAGPERLATPEGRLETIAQLTKAIA
jgi:transcriptional regulator with XRE-family HTH domain